MQSSKHNTLVWPILALSDTIEKLSRIFLLFNRVKKNRLFLFTSPRSNSKSVSNRERGACPNLGLKCETSAGGKMGIRLWPFLANFCPALNLHLPDFYAVISNWWKHSPPQAEFWNEHRKHEEKCSMERKIDSVTSKICELFLSSMLSGEKIIHEWLEQQLLKWCQSTKIRWSSNRALILVTSFCFPREILSASKFLSKLGKEQRTRFSQRKKASLIDENYLSLRAFESHHAVM